MSKNFQRCFLYFIKLERYTVHCVYVCVVHLHWESDVTHFTPFIVHGEISTKQYQTC